MLGRTSSAASERFAARRRTRRRRIVIALVLLFSALVGGTLYELHQPALRISKITIYGGEESLSRLALDAMQGSYFGVVPRDSTFFFPGGAIRDSILGAHADIAAVSIFRDGFTGLSIKPNERVAIARWCGLGPTPPDSGAHGSDEYCYVFDANGFVFAAAGTSSEPINRFSVYAPLAGGAEEPLRATLASETQLPATFDFARQLSSLGGSVERIVIRGDEVDQLLKSGTRITYILGDERNAYAALVAAKDNLNLADGSIEYVDLRFGGKMYVKKM